jgi:hypothetical protein
MHGGGRELEIAEARPRKGDGGPWAVALNETAATDVIEVTLLALSVLDDVLNVSGILRGISRSDVQLSSVPTLALAALDGPPLGLIGGHSRPGRGAVWVSWTYERPAEVYTRYEGRIDRIELAYRAGRIVQQAVPGPWVFAFSVPNMGVRD